MSRVLTVLYVSPSHVPTFRAPCSSWQGTEGFLTMPCIQNLSRVYLSVESQGISLLGQLWTPDFMSLFSGPLMRPNEERMGNVFSGQMAGRFTHFFFFG